MAEQEDHTFEAPLWSGATQVSSPETRPNRVDLDDGCGRRVCDAAVLLSGGVDSPVALRLTQQTGAHVEAYYLKIWLEDEVAHLGACPWQDNIAQARAVCVQAGVRLQEVGLQREYWERVVGYAVSEARRGQTPKLGVRCNSCVKFGAFFDVLDGAFEAVVSGHYAQVGREDDGPATL